MKAIIAPFFPRRNGEKRFFRLGRTFPLHRQAPGSTRPWPRPEAEHAGENYLYNALPFAVGEFLAPLGENREKLFHFVWKPPGKREKSGEKIGTLFQKAEIMFHIGETARKPAIIKGDNCKFCTQNVEEMEEIRKNWKFP